MFGVAPSLWPEPFGSVVHEGMSRGRALIGTTPGGHADMIEHGVTGLLVPAGDAAALREAMRSLIAHRRPARAPRRRREGALAGVHGDGGRSALRSSLRAPDRRPGGAGAARSASAPRPRRLERRRCGSVEVTRQRAGGGALLDEDLLGALRDALRAGRPRDAP